MCSEGLLTIKALTQLPVDTSRKFLKTQPLTVTILIKVLRQSKGYSAKELLQEFPDKDWCCSALERLLRQIDAIESATLHRQEVRQQQRTYGLHKRQCKCLCKWRPL